MEAGRGLGWAMTYWSFEHYNSAFEISKYLFQFELIIAIKLFLVLNELVYGTKGSC